MSNFWQQRIAPAAPEPAAQPAAAPSNRPWWQPQVAAPAQPQHPVQATSQHQAREVLDGLANGSVTPAEDLTLSEALTQDGYTSTKAQSSKDTELCPNCGSTNYMRASGSPNSMKQCFECGQNPRFEQMAGGTTGIPTKGPVRAARVQNPGDPSFKPMGSVVGHI